MGDEILIGRNHVSEQDMQNALRGAFLEGFKEGVSVSQRSLFANVYIEHLLRTSTDKTPTEIGESSFAFADIIVACGRPKKPTADGGKTTQ
jgi:hypothetical protein